MTELSITRDNASASPPRIIVLMVALPSFSTMNVASAEIGIESSTAVVARIFPRNSRIMMLVSTRPMRLSCSTVLIASLTKTD